jgi:hypothetical protein
MIRAVTRRRSPARWKLPTTARSIASARRSAESSRPDWAIASVTRNRSMMRSVAARRSLVRVSAIPDDNQASEASPLTFSKSRTATVGAGGSAGSRTGAAMTVAGETIGSTGEMNR